MRTVRVVVLNELGEDCLEVPLVEDDQMVETLVPQGPNDPLRDRIRAGRPHRAEQGLDTQAPGPLDEVPTIGGIPVAQ